MNVTTPNGPAKNKTEEVELWFPPAGGLEKPVKHELKTIGLIRAIRRRIRHLQALPELAAERESGELGELQLALQAVGGTEVVWNMDIVKRVVANSVRTALQHAAPEPESSTSDASPTDFNLFNISS